MRSDRLLSLLLLLQARGRVTAPAVARELEVSVRTVYRDVESLSAAGVPVYTEQGRGGGIALMPGYRTDVTGLTAAESRALVAMTGRALPEDLGLGTALAGAVHKLMAAVPASHRGEAERARQRVLVDHDGWYRPRRHAEHLPSVQDAVWADRRLKLRYRHGEGQQADYLLDPYGLVVKAGVWYLIAAHRGRPRLFRIDRITSATTLAAAAERPADLDLATLWADLRDRIETPRDATPVRLRVRSELVPSLLRITSVQRFGADPATIPEPDAGGWVELELTFRVLGAAHGSLAGFGAAVEVLSPESLREQLLATARDLVALYTPAERA
jgi:predicted DNA-binding transcriptional regulator YafY